MAHYAFTHKHTGEVRFVDHELNPTDWDKSHALSRAPTVFDDFVNGKLIRNREREARVNKVSHANGLSREALVDMISALESRIDALEKVRGVP